MINRPLTPQDVECSNGLHQRLKGCPKSKDITGDCCKKVQVDDVVSAREWLKEQLSDSYHGIGKTVVWMNGGSDQMCDLVDEFVAKKIDEAFGGVDK